MSGFESPSWRPSEGGPISTRVECGDESHVGEVRRAADSVARACGLDDHARGTLGIVATETATNLARHAQRGYVLLRGASWGGVPGVELLGVDYGPGMHDLEPYFADGYSTGGTAGTGLGAMRRQADVLDVYSQPGQGTVVLARVFRAPAPQATAAWMDCGTVCRPVDGETACGDGWSMRQEDDRIVVLLVDGLGHGPAAAEAADVAIDVFRRSGSRGPKEIVAVVHEALRATRGAAVAVAELRRTGDGASVVLCGVGNTVATIVGAAGQRALPSMNGTAGLSVRTMQTFTQPLALGDALVMHTDGITSRWRLDAYPRIREHHPAITAAMIARDAVRGHDDATVLALALRREPGA